VPNNFVRTYFIFCTTLVKYIKGDEPFVCIQYKLAEVVLDYRRNLFGARRRDRQRTRRRANSQASCLWGYYA